MKWNSSPLPKYDTQIILTTKISLLAFRVESRQRGNSLDSRSRLRLEEKRSYLIHKADIESVTKTAYFHLVCNRLKAYSILPVMVRVCG